MNKQKEINRLVAFPRFLNILIICSSQYYVLAKKNTNPGGIAGGGGGVVTAGIDPRIRIVALNFCAISAPFTHNNSTLDTQFSTHKKYLHTSHNNSCSYVCFFLKFLVDVSYSCCFNLTQMWSALLMWSALPAVSFSPTQNE
jgi:hypothetical protein